MSAPTKLPVDPASTSKEGKAEEKKMQSTFKDMYKHEKSEAKASKVRV